MALALYQGALKVLEPLVWGYFRRRGRDDTAYLENWSDRRGQGETFDATIWIHTVSLGEFRSAEPLIETLLIAGHRLLITHATPAGRNASQTALADYVQTGQVTIRYAPIDRIAYWSSFFAAHKPRLGLVFEMEFWPGMIETAAKAGVPLWLVNSQIPGKTFPRARRVAGLLGAHAAGRAARVFAKSDRMADRFRRVGAQNVTVMGETRFDIPPPPEQVAKGTALKTSLHDRPVFTFASVIAGEEETYLTATKAAEGALVVWVPRAPELFEATFERLKGEGLRVLRRSDAYDDHLNGAPDFSDVDVLLGDSFGEMFFFLAAADVVSVGGGFVEKGAHNVIEPLALGKPVVTGPHIWTIEFPGVEAIEAGVLKVCGLPKDLAPALQATGVSGSDSARAFHAEYSGASARLFQDIQQHFEESR